MKSLKSLTSCQAVKLYAKREGMQFNATGGIPTLYKWRPNANLYWVEIFNDWDEAKEFLVKCKNTEITPWND